MTISNKYLKYLNHFNKTQTLSNFHKYGSNVVSLRHDVDHSIDAALEMAFFENYHGYRSTYFILPYSSYWNDNDLYKKILQIADFGHEIGIHFNGISDWINHNISDIEYDLIKIIKNFNENGIRINGISSHGDSLCYKYNYINYWAFKNIKPDNPKLSESGRTAEGVVDKSGEKKIIYPDDDCIIRDDGKKFKFWSIDYNSLKIKYHAWHLKFNNYYSDSGGSWKRTNDPLNFNITNNKTQVLIHPEYWLDTPKLYFFLGPARSGSTWLSNIINKSSNIKARHEYLLNQAFFNKEVNFKHTHHVRKLEKNNKFINNRFINFWEEFYSSNVSIAEVNIYLENFIQKLQNIFPNAIYIYLKRNPYEVISSLMNRGWYIKYPDPLRPSIKYNVGNQKRLFFPIFFSNQFFRVISYVQQTYNNLNNKCNYSIDMNKSFQDVEYLKTKLFKIGIYLYPLFIENYNDKLNLNKNKNNNFQNFSKWSVRKKNIYKSIFFNLNKFRLLKNNKTITRYNNLEIEFSNEDLFFQSSLINANGLLEINLHISLLKCNNRRVPLTLFEFKSKTFFGLNFTKSLIFRRHLFFMSQSVFNYKINVPLHPNTKLIYLSIPKRYIEVLNIKKCNIKLFR